MCFGDPLSVCDIAKHFNTLCCALSTENRISFTEFSPFSYEKNICVEMNIHVYLLEIQSSSHIFEFLVTK